MMELETIQVDESSAVQTSKSLERAVLFTLATVQFTSIVDFMIIMPLGPQLKRTLGTNPEQFSNIVSAYTIAAGLTGIVASSFIDRFSRKAAFLTLYVGFLVGTLLCGLAPSYALLLAARVVTGAFGGILGGLAMAIIGDVFPDERRGRATGVLMSAFSLASILGVPFGLFLGNKFGWHAPFLMLVGLGFPILIVGMIYLPPLRDHLTKAKQDQWGKLVETYTHPNHLRAFALVVSVMLGTFMVVPSISLYLVNNAGLTESGLPWIYFGGGVCSLISSPLIGRWADQSGKLLVYRFVAPLSAVMMFTLTNFPNIPGVLSFSRFSVSIGLLAAVAAVSLLMVSNSGRMVAAMAMINASVEPRLRGGFMSAYSSVQHLSAGLGAYIAGKIIIEADGKLEHYAWVGWLGIASTLLSLWLAGRLKPASVAPNPQSEPLDELIESVPNAEAF